MNRSIRVALWAVTVALLLAVEGPRIRAQQQAATPPQAEPQKASPPSAAAPDEEQEEDLFAPVPAPPLPPGMSGSDAEDPRARLAPGLYDAGEAAMGIKHLLLLKKPDAFQLGTADPDDPKVERMVGQLGIGRRRKLSK